MKISIKATNITLTPAISDFIEKKLDPLEKFIRVLYNTHRFSTPSGKTKTKVEAWIEVGKETFHHRKGFIFRAEGQIRFNGKSVRVETIAKDLRVAIGEMREIMKRELKKIQLRTIAKKKRKSRAARREIKIAPQARFHRKGRIREEGL